MPDLNKPKIELHLHLEGAAPPSFIRQLAHEQKADISGIFDADGGYDYRDFTHFLSVYETATSVLRTPMDFHRLTLAVLEQSAEQNVIYTEAFLSPDFCGKSDLSAWRDYLAAIEEAAAIAEQKFGIVMRGIATAIRHFGAEKAKKAALCAAETRGGFITGFGMAGAETVGKQADYAYSFDMAREAGLRLTSHAGEWGGAESVRQALFDLNVERLGHGVQVIDDDALVDEVIAREVTLEVCPGSNVVLGVYPSLREHPIEQLRARGVKVTVSTDDPPFFKTTLRQEYAALADVFGWQDDDFLEINQIALSNAFCDEETKASLQKRLTQT